MFRNYKMIRSFLLITFIIDILFISVATTKERYHGPMGLDENEATTCDEFSKYARFNPYSVLDSEWMVFFYWGPVRGADFYTFYIPGEKQLNYLKDRLDGSVKEPVNWTAKYVLMKDRSNVSSLLVERSNRGEYNMYMPYGGLKKNDVIEPIDVRIKQTGDNRYLGIMACKSHLVYVMARVKDVPPKSKIQDAVSRLGYRGRGGKSYLYQGHHWLPIPEADERLYWKPSRLRHWYLYE